MSILTAADLAGLIDHTILKPDATRADVARLCDEAIAHRFASVCVNPVHTAFVAGRLAVSSVRTCVVIGFPLGASGASGKADEAARVAALGADELDMVIDVGALKEGDLDRVRADIAAVRAACPGKTLKVIIETCLLTDGEKETACRIAKEEKADFVKTSTGFSSGGATPEDIALMRRVVGPGMGVKASGGIRTTEAALAMVKAGATRIGASSSLAIIGATTKSASGY